MRAPSASTWMVAMSLTAASSVAAARQLSYHRLFTFDASFAGPADQAVALPVGTVIQPISQSQPDLIFQPVVVCSEGLVLQFDEHGVSDPVSIRGFCSAPGVPVADADVYWGLTGLRRDPAECAASEKRDQPRDHEPLPPPISEDNNAAEPSVGGADFSWTCDVADALDCESPFQEAFQARFGTPYPADGIHCDAVVYTGAAGPQRVYACWAL